MYRLKESAYYYTTSSEKCQEENRTEGNFFEKKSIFRYFLFICIKNRPFYGIEIGADGIRLILVRRAVSVGAVSGAESCGTARIDVRPVVADHPRTGSVRTRFFQYMIQCLGSRFQREPGIRPDHDREQGVDPESIMYDNFGG